MSNQEPTEHRRRESLRESLSSPHLEAGEHAELGFEEWAERLPEENTADLVDLDSGIEVCWTPGEGWREVGG